MRRPLALAVLVAVLLGFWGCDAVWLPDSSGILFIRNKSHSVVRYDIASGKETVVVKYGWLVTDGVDGRVAIRPDGKQVAVVRHRVKGGADTVQVFIHELSGKLIHASRELAVPLRQGAKPFPGDGVARACWSPDGRRILVNFSTVYPVDYRKPRPERAGGPQEFIAAVYDVKADAARFHPGLTEIEEFAMGGPDAVRARRAGLPGRPPEPRTAQGPGRFAGAGRLGGQPARLQGHRASDQGV